MKISITIKLLTLREWKNGGIYLISIMIDFSVGKKSGGGEDLTAS